MSSSLEELAGRWRAAWQGPAGGFESCCTPDVAYEDPVAVVPLEGIEALEAHAQGLRRAFPDIRVEASGESIGSGNLACLTWRALGTHRGELAGLPASNRFVVLHGVHYVELDDGHVRRARGFFDVYEAAVQLGLLPAHGSFGEKALLMLRGFGYRSTST
ncbi:MAG TPA: ester cyclase [Thermoleophilaceae bacterium]